MSSIAVLVTEIGVEDLKRLAFRQFELNLTTVTAPFEIVSPFAKLFPEVRTKICLVYRSLSFNDYVSRHANWSKHSFLKIGKRLKLQRKG